MIKSGIIGVGRWGSKHVEEWLEVNCADLKIVCDTDVDKASFYESKDLSFITDYKTLLKKDLDCFSVCTPNETHFTIARELLMAGKHVLLEKPMCLESKDCLMLHEIAEKKGLVLTPGHIYRFNSALKLIKSKINGLGKVKRVELAWIDTKTPSTSRGILFDLGPHMWDILNFLFDDKPEVFEVENNHSEALVSGVIRGINYSINLNWNGKDKKRELLVEGENGKIFLDVAKQIIKEPSGLKHVPNNTLRAEIQHFVDCVAGRAEPVINGLTGYKSIRWVEKCLKKA